MSTTRTLTFSPEAITWSRPPKADVVGPAVAPYIQKVFLASWSRAAGSPPRRAAVRLQRRDQRVGSRARGVEIVEGRKVGVAGGPQVSRSLRRERGDLLPQAGALLLHEARGRGRARRCSQENVGPGRAKPRAFVV